MGKIIGFILFQYHFKNTKFIILKTFTQLNVIPSPSVPTTDFYLRFNYDLTKPLSVRIFLVNFFFLLNRLHSTKNKFAKGTIWYRRHSRTRRQMLFN